MNKKKRGNYKTKNVLILQKMIKEVKLEEEKEKKEDKKNGND